MFHVCFQYLLVFFQSFVLVIEEKILSNSLILILLFFDLLILVKYLSWK
jgi:hypothetical protein